MPFSCHLLKRLKAYSYTGVNSSVCLAFFGFDFEQMFMIFLPLQHCLKIFEWVDKGNIYQNMYSKLAKIAYSRRRLSAKKLYKNHISDFKCL
jgi:hypothetical protein